MSLNILNVVKQTLPSDFVSKFSEANGESEADVHKGIEAIVPTFLLQLIAIPREKFEGVWDTIKGFISHSSAPLTTGGLSNESGLVGSTLQHIFGDKLSSVTNAIAGFSNLKPSSTQGLLNEVAPVTLNAIGTHISAENPSGVLEFLKSQKDHLLAALPAGLSLGSLGLNSFKSALTHETSHTPTTHSDNGKTGGGSGFLKILIALLVIGALIYFFSKGCNKKDDQASASKDSTTTVSSDTTPTAAVATPSVHENIKVQLPNGQELNAYKGGIEDKLVAFLKTDYKKLGADSLKNIWFDFDNLNFETNSDKITDSSQAQVNNIVAILKAFPTAKIKIGGYTDKTGDEAHNLKLSKERATAVQASLTKAGVGPQVTGADGYGSQYAKFPSTAPESDRVNDRHVSVSVRE